MKSVEMINGICYHYIWSNRVQGVLTSILHRMEVVQMNNNNGNNRFDFKDLMAFGMFILALLTFIFTNLK